MRRALLAVVLLVGCAGAASALTVRDVIELSKAGLSEDVLLALIDVDGGVYANDTATLKELKSAGVSERVIIALIRSGRERRPLEPQPVAVPQEDPVAPPPQVVVIEHHEPPQVQQVVVPMPIYVPVTTGRGRVRRDAHESVPYRYVPFQSGLPAAQPTERTGKREPVYWGFGGKLRPDAWGQPTDRDKDNKPKEKQ